MAKILIDLNQEDINKSQITKKKWFDPKTGNFLSLREYNKLAQKANRKGKTVSEYFEEIGLIKENKLGV